MCNYLSPGVATLAFDRVPSACDDREPRTAGCGVPRPHAPRERADVPRLVPDRHHADRPRLAAAQFLTYEASGGVPLVEVLATILVVSGIVVTLIGAWRYLTGRDRIDVMDFRPAYRSILATTAAAIVVGVVAIVFVWLLRPG